MLSLATCISYVDLSSMLRMCGHVSAGFSTVFIILSQLFRKLEFDDNNIITIQVKASKYATY